jgi:hypothetical protein
LSCFFSLFFLFSLFLLFFPFSFDGHRGCHDCSAPLLTRPCAWWSMYIGTTRASARIPTSPRRWCVRASAELRARYDTHLTSSRARQFRKTRTPLTAAVWTGAGCDGDRQALGQQQPGGQPLRCQRQPAR